MDDRENEKISHRKNWSSGKRLEYFLNHYNIKQKELANNVGYSTVYVNNIIKDKKCMTVDMATKIEDYYHKRIIMADFLLCKTVCMNLTELYIFDSYEELNKILVLKDIFNALGYVMFNITDDLSYTNNINHKKNDELFKYLTETNDKYLTFQDSNHSEMDFPVGVPFDWAIKRKNEDTCMLLTSSDISSIWNGISMLLDIKIFSDHTKEVSKISDLPLLRDATQVFKNYSMQRIIFRDCFMEEDTISDNLQLPDPKVYRKKEKKYIDKMKNKAPH